MNRTDRLYALVEELRAVAPRPRSASWLAARFEVSVRTVERDISALQQSGTPIWAETGRTGGYSLDHEHTLPPVNLTPSEAVAMAVGLERLKNTPFRQAARSAMLKLVAAMQATDADAARALAARVYLLGEADPVSGPPAQLAAILSAGKVFRMRYRDREGRTTSRSVEPLGCVGTEAQWYLIAWCRLREEVRAFRLDRIASLIATTENAPRRRLQATDLDIPYGDVRELTLT